MFHRFRTILLRTGLVPILLLAVPLLTTSCGRSGDSARNKVLLIALDGVTWDILHPMMDQGRLPNLKRLSDNGYASHLGTVPPPSLSPVIWTTVATGKPLEEHGIHHFIYAVSKGDVSEQRPYTSDMRKVPAFWNILSDFDRSCGVVGWWVSWPAEPINGVVVTSYSAMKVAKRLWKGQAYKDFKRQTYPDEFMAETLRPIIEECEKTVNDRLNDGIFHKVAIDRMNHVQQLVIDDTRSVFLSDEIYGNVAKKLLAEREDLDVIAVYLSGTDVASHRFWQYFDPKGLPKFDVSPDEIEMLGGVIPDYYEYVDEVIGELIAADPSRTVIVCSDHGFHAETRPPMPVDERSGGHETADLPGILILNGPGIKARDRTREVTGDVPTIYDVLPTMLYLQGMSTARDMPGRVITEAFDPSGFVDHPVTSIESYDWSPDRPREAGVIARPTGLEDAWKERLKTLGYIGNAIGTEKKKEKAEPAGGSGS